MIPLPWGFDRPSSAFVEVTHIDGQISPAADVVGDVVLVDAEIDDVEGVVVFGDLGDTDLDAQVEGVDVSGEVDS